MALRDQTKISHYVIQSKLGAGGMGEAYKGLDTSKTGQAIQTQKAGLVRVIGPRSTHAKAQGAHSGCALV
jgi:hypothetical protein